MCRAANREAPTASLMETPMKTLIAALTLGAVVAVPALIESANAASNQSREQIIHECMMLQNRSSHDGYEGNKGGGLQWHYRACMNDHGQPP